MQYTGRIFSDAALPGLRPSERAAIYESAAETLARLHRVDFVRAGLEGFGRAEGGYLGRQVATLERVASKQVWVYHVYSWLCVVYQRVSCRGGLFRGGRCKAVISCNTCFWGRTAVVSVCLVPSSSAWKSTVERRASQSMSTAGSISAFNLLSEHLPPVY